MVFGGTEPNAGLLQAPCLSAFTVDTQEVKGAYCVVLFCSRGRLVIHDLRNDAGRYFQPLSEALERAMQAVQREPFQIRGGARMGYFNRNEQGDLVLLLVYMKAKFDNIPAAALLKLKEALDARD